MRHFLPTTSPRKAALTIGAGLSLVAAITGASLAASAGATSLGPTNAQRLTLAKKDAAHLLSLVVPPAGSKTLSGPINGKKSPLASPAQLSSDPDIAVSSHFYLAPKTAAANAWIKSHAPKGSTLSGTGSTSGPGYGPIKYYTFSFNSSGVLNVPELNFSVLPTSKGAEIRVDAEVGYLPQKSKYAIVGSGATTMKVSATRSSSVTTDRTTEVDTTTAATITAAIAKVNGLEVALPGVHSCPVDLGATMTISFYKSSATSPYATVVADPEGCGQVTITQYSASGSVLGVGHDEGGGDISNYLATTLGITNWPGSTTP
jgi:hypothetical protein